MKKSHIRDYATEAFRFWAMNGPADAYRKKLYDEAMAAEQRAEGGGVPGGSPTEGAVARAERRLEECDAAIKDLEAVDRTMELLKNHPAEPCIGRALRMVYMEKPEYKPRRGEIHARVLHAADRLGISEDAIYKWLSHARILFARERGLRVFETLQ